LPTEMKDIKYQTLLKEKSAKFNFFFLVTRINNIKS